jgi:hypothetical protein
MQTFRGLMVYFKVAKALRKAPACPKHGRDYLAVCLEKRETRVFCAKCGVPEEIVHPSR